MRYTIRVTKRFIKDAELCKRRGYDMHIMQKAMQMLAENGTLQIDRQLCRYVGMPFAARLAYGVETD